MYSLLVRRKIRVFFYLRFVDGLANKGIGSMDDIFSDKDKESVETFFASIGSRAQENGTTISVISLAGDNVKLELLGKLADMTYVQSSTFFPLPKLFFSQKF